MRCLSLIGPTGPAGFVWYRGETELARAAAKANIPFTVASTSNTPLEDIYQNGGGTQWYQLYVWQDIDASLVTAKRALDAGYEALVLTVDSPVYNNREIDVRNGLKFPPTIGARTALDVMLHPRWLFGTLAKYYFAEGQLPAFSNIHIPDEQKAHAKSYESAATTGFLNRNETLDWDFVKRLRDLWPKKLLIKCVLHPEDAAAAAACGVDGVFVSNHAGNVNDCAITAWDAFPPFQMPLAESSLSSLTLACGVEVMSKGACPRRGYCRYRPGNTLWRRCCRRSRRHPGVGDPGGGNPAHHGGHGARPDFRY